MGSGLTSGSQSDAEPIKDKNGLPYIPGKTIKGLLKDALMEICNNNDDYDKDKIRQIFGYEIIENNKVIQTKAGKAFFSNATLSELEQEEIDSYHASFLYRNIASTQIDKAGVAVGKSLRTIQVCMPIVLKGYIDGLGEGDEERKGDKKYKSDSEIIINSFYWVRHMGVNRNRGLGRCSITLVKD